jgi:anti-sigma factor RsiW
MSQLCSDLIRFADGELAPERAEMFRSHLLTCVSCRTDLVEAIQLQARLTGLQRIDPAIATPTTSPDTVESGA